MRPSERLSETGRVLALTLEPMARLARGASAIDQAAFAYAAKGLEQFAEWRRDTTEASRRNAWGEASACAAVATQSGSPYSAALQAFSVALQSALKADIEGACKWAGLASRQLARTA